MKILKMLLAGIMVMSVANSSVFAAKKGTLVIEGSTTVLPIAQAAAEEFMDRYDGDISVRGGGSGVGIASLLQKRCDIGDASRPIKDKELAKAASMGVEVKAHVVAMDGIAVIVNPSNPVSKLSQKQVEDIFTGKIKNWSQLGGKDKKIVAVSRDTASGTYEAFNKLALKKKKVRSDALMQASNQAVASVIAQTPGGIGYVGHGYLSSKVKAVSIDGIRSSKNTILSGKYPYSRPLFMYTNGKPVGLTKEFIDFVLSYKGQKIVEEQGFVSLK